VNTPRLDAVLFDMDGTLIDSEPNWIRAETELIESFGGTWSAEQGLALVGSGLWDSARAIQSAGVELELAEIIDRLSLSVRTSLAESVPWRPGALEMISQVLEAGIPTALVTMSFRQNAVFIAEQMSAELGREAFTKIIAGDDVTEAKPNPEPYLLAATQLGVDIHHCVAFEDSVFGAASAFSAGAVTIGVPLHIEIPASYASVLWPSMEDKSLADIHFEVEQARGVAQ
jgi:HAD superfamily hydrolase (TIGR01509 family)